MEEWWLSADACGRRVWRGGGGGAADVLVLDEAVVRAPHGVGGEREEELVDGLGAGLHLAREGRPCWIPGGSQCGRRCA